MTLPDKNIVIDWDRIALFTDNDPEETQALVALFIDSGIEMLEKLRQTELSPEEWKAASHRLKGSAANIGAEKLASACALAETDWNASASMKHNHKIDIETQWAELCRALAQGRP